MKQEYDKCIIGSNHGNLGYTITTHHLGYTFKSEDVKDLTDVIRYALTNDFKRDRQYYEYKDSLNPDIFRKSYMSLYGSLL